MKKVLGMKGVIFETEEIAQAIKTNSLLNLDFCIPCKCRLNCVYCFQATGKKGKELDTDEILSAIDQVADLGAMVIEYLGQGEPLLNKDFFKILEHTNRRGITPVLFTCGDVIGDDDLAKQVHRINGHQIVRKLDEYNVSVLLKYEKKNQDEISKKRGYSAIRERALKRLIQAGFNSHTPTRLGITSVILNINYDELRSIYRWALSNNIYPHYCVLMPCGRAKDVNKRDLDISGDELINMAIDNIIASIKMGYQYIGPTPFPGGVTCEHLRIGLHLDNFGDMYLCSGEDSNPLGNIKKSSIKSIWENSYPLREVFLPGHGCPWKEKVGTITNEYYSRVSEAMINWFLSSNQFSLSR